MSHVTGLEAGELAQEGEGDFAGGAVTLLGDDQFGLAPLLGFLFIILGIVGGAVEESHDIGILLDGAGLTEIGDARLPVSTVFGFTVKLGENDDRYFKFLGERLDSTGDLGDLDLPVFLAALGGGLQKLQIVDDDKAQTMLVHESSGFCTELVDAKTSSIINEHLALAEFPRDLEKALVGILGKQSCPDTLEVHPGSRAEQTLDELLGAHFQTEDGDWDIFIDRDMFCDVHRKGRLSHGGSRRDDNHFARVHAAGHVVEDLESGGNSGHLTLVLVKFFDGVDGVVHVLFDVREFSAHAVLSHAEDLLLDIVDQHFHFTLFLIASGCGTGACRDHAAQEMLFPHDVDVVLGIGGSGEEGLEIGQISRPTNLFQQIPVRKGLRDGDQIDGAILLPEILQDGIDRSMGGMVEVLIADPFFDGCGQRVLGREQDGREDTFLGIKTGREWTMSLRKALTL